MQLPQDLGNKHVYSQEEAMAAEASARQSEYEKTIPLAADRAAPDVGSRVGQDADFDFYGSYTTVANYAGEYRTSLIVKPENGRCLDRGLLTSLAGIAPYDESKYLKSLERRGSPLVKQMVETT